jgi:hypothetical protein
LPVAVGHGTCWLVAAAAVGVILCRYHLGDPKIDKNRQKSTKFTIHVLKKSGGVIFKKKTRQVVAGTSFSRKKTRQVVEYVE